MTRYLLLMGILFVQACTTTDLRQPQQGGNTTPANPEVDNVEPVITGRVSDPFLRARILADMLFEASMAFDDNRLLLPPGNNAYDRYMEVLSFEPDNQVALQGIQDIVDRYVAMANQAIQIGQFDNAEAYLNRAASINPGQSNIIEARRVLNLEQGVGREYFTLDPQELTTQSLAMMSQLGSIGEFVRDYDATFLITARSDAEARWIYQIMREAVGGYRLRGNVTLGPQPTVQVNIPQT
ncbi:hypothetical protein JYU22_03015 [Gammaproteobacteria bacterium AH-315-E17]|nr:hypothetical protein [Gammaproteobacteria bacterium AH-315-E17]